MRLAPDFPSSGYNPVALPQTAAIMSAKKKFVSWLNKKHPALLRRALDEMKQSGLNGLGESEAAWYDDLLNTVENIVPVWAGIEQQKQLIKINEERAKSGLPPLNAPPTIRVEGEAGPETRAAIGAGMKEAIGQYMPLIAVGGGLLLFTMMRPKRRR